MVDDNDVPLTPTPVSKLADDELLKHWRWTLNAAVDHNNDALVIAATLSDTQIAKMLGVTVKTVKEWHDRKLRHNPDRYDLAIWLHAPANQVGRQVCTDRHNYMRLRDLINPAILSGRIKEFEAANRGLAKAIERRDKQVRKLETALKAIASGPSEVSTAEDMAEIAHAVLGATP